MDRLIKTPDTPSITQNPSKTAQNPLSLIFPGNGGEKIREELRRLQLADIVDYVDDLGDLAVKNITQIGDSIIEYAEAGHKICSFIPKSGHKDLGATFWQAYDNPVYISCDTLINHPEVSHIGIQRHYYPQSWTYNPNKHLRLKTVREHNEQAEVLLRTADCIVLSLGALRLSDNMGSSSSCVAGLMIEELCMIAKYTGASTKLRTILIEGYDQNEDVFGVQAKNAALLLYYVIDGYHIRSREIEQSVQVQRYSVMPEHISQEIIFVEDQRSSRWWIELYSEAAEEVVQMPCTKKDYEDACSNIISDRITSLVTMT